MPVQNKNHVIVSKKVVNGFHVGTQFRGVKGRRPILKLTGSDSHHLDHVAAFRGCLFETSLDSIVPTVRVDGYNFAILLTVIINDDERIVV